MESTSTYLWPGTVHFGPGVAKLVGKEALAREAKSAFIVVDPGVMKAGLLDVILDAIYALNMVFTIHDDVVPIQVSRDYANQHSEVKLIELDSDHGLNDVQEDIWQLTKNFLNLA